MALLESLLSQIFKNQLPVEFEEFDPIEEKPILDKINSYISLINIFTKLVNIESNKGEAKNQAKGQDKDDDKTNVHYFIKQLVVNLENLTDFKKFLDHPVYFNEYKDKYGHTYIQARAYIMDEKNKKKWFTAYVGPKPDNTPADKIDPESTKKGRLLIRKKLLPYYQFRL